MKQILVFILFISIFCWLMFSPVYRHVMVVRHAVLQQEVDYLLEIGANADHGFISPQMINVSRDRMAERGFRRDRLTYEISTSTGISGTDSVNPVPRGDGIIIELSYPTDGLFTIDRLIGLRIDDHGMMTAKGKKMSEYVPLYW